MTHGRLTAMRRLLLAVPMLIVGVGGCGSDDDDDAGAGGDTTGLAAEQFATSAPSTSIAEPVVDTDAPSTVPPPPEGAVGSDEELAIADLAARQGVDPAAITTVSVENVTWRDGAIGCPESGMNYIQVLTDGVRVILEADGIRYQYHSGGGQGPLLCEEPDPPVGD